MSSSARHHAETAVPRVDLFRCHGLLADTENQRLLKASRRWNLDRAFYYQPPVRQDVHYFQAQGLFGPWRYVEELHYCFYYVNFGIV